MPILEALAKKAKDKQADQSLVSLTKERIEQTKDQINNAQNYINLSYYLGKQWIHWDATNKRVYEASPTPGKCQFTANRIQKIVRTELAKITKNKPIMTCVPASNAEDDVRASDVGDKILEYLEYKHEMHQKVDKKVLMWGLTTEAGYVHPYWNVGKGEGVQDPETGQKVMTGDEAVDVLSPFEVMLDPDAKTWDDLAWFIKPKVRKVKYIEDTYGKKVAPDSEVIENGMARQMESLYAKYGQKPEKKSKDMVTIYECWEAPSKEYANGRRWAVAGDQLLYSIEDIGFGSEDDTERILPLFPFINIEVPGRIQGQAIVEVLIPIQREYNRSRSQIIDNADLMADPIWLIQDGAVEDEDDIPTGAGGILNYNNGFNIPQRDQPPSLSADVYRNLESLQEEFYFISGQQEVSHGSAPTGVTSGVAIGYLQEQDNTVIAPTISNFISCKQGYMGYLLKMVKFKYDYPRQIRIVGENNEVNLMEFRGSDLRSTDVRIQEGTMYQDSKPAKQQWILNMIQAGVLNPQTDRGMIIRMLDIGLVDEMYDESQIDVDQARKEHVLWEKQDFDNVIVRDFFNHEAHIVEHNRFRKGDVYDDMGPLEQQRIDEHVLEHQVYVQKAQAEAMQQAMMMQGGMGNGQPMSNV